MPVLMISLFLFINTPTLKEVRDLYQSSAQNEKKCTELIRLLNNYDESKHPLFAGYKASATMMMAKHTSNPFQKLSYFNRGKRLLEKAIAKSPGNVELRCLRFAAQSNIPSFLGYNNNLEADKTFILQGYSSVKDAVLKENIRQYLTKWGELTNNQKQMLR